MHRILMLVIVAALALSACGQRVDAEASGQEVYLQVCARCHADNLTGGFGPPLVGADSPSLEKPPEFFEQTIRTGLGRMPSFGGALSDAQIDRLVAYILEQQGR